MYKAVCHSLRALKETGSGSDSIRLYLLAHVKKHIQAEMSTISLKI